jgi:membrane protein YqaA with SNARE-associated domain
VAEFLIEYGLLGLFIGSFLASTLIPLSSEILLTAILYSGVSPLYAFIVATLGNWLGGMTSYYIGRLGKWEIIEKWLRIKPESLLKQKSKVDFFGSYLAFFAWLPLVGDLFAVALGFYRVNLTKSAIFMLLGRAVRFFIFIYLYQFIEKLFISG